MEIKQGSNEFYIGGSPSQAVARITFIKESDTLIVADHTFVAPELRGQNIAKQLLDRLAEYARDNHLKIKPLCSYVVKAFEKFDTYQDVQAGKDDANA